MTSTKIKAFEGDGVLVETAEGEKKIPADTMIVSFGMKPNSGIVEAICEKYPTTQVVGDCTGVAQVGEAVRGGFFAAWSIH